MNLDMEIVTEENYSKPNAMGKIDNVKEIYTSKVEMKSNNILSSQKKVPISSAALRVQENIRDTVENNNNSALIENDDEN